MIQLSHLVQRVWGSRPCRTLIAGSFAVIMGVGAGRMFIGSVYVVDGKSMEPAYPEGTHLYGIPISTPVDRGDVVILDDGHADYAVKRVVGLPGETIQLWRGSVFIDRQLLVEPYLPKYTYTCPMERVRRGASFVLGEGEYFVLGDNRTCSADSRIYGPVQRKQIKWRVPLPDSFVSAYCTRYTLPAYGNTVMRPVAARQAGTKAALSAGDRK
jgi:signal peptidase I